MVITLATAAFAAPFTFGGQFEIDGAHVVQASSAACTYAILMGGGAACPEDNAEAELTTRGRLPSSKKGGRLIVTAIPTHLSTAASQARDNCGAADAATEASHQVSYSATGVANAVTAQGAIVVSHLGKATETDTRGSTPAPNCRVHANGDSTNDTSGDVTIRIPFTIAPNAGGTFALSLQAANIGENTDFTWNYLKVTASAGPLSCEVDVSGRSMDSCLQASTLEEGAYTMTVTVEHSSGMTVDSEANPGELHVVNDLFTAQVVPVARATTSTDLAMPTAAK